jgi:adenylyltransferase/sulfurtransferase
MGSMQAMEVIKEILGIGESLAGRLLMYDALAARFYETTLAWNPENPLNGRKPTITALEAANYGAG